MAGVFSLKVVGFKRIWDYCIANPFLNTAYNAVVARMGGLLNEAQLLMAQQREGRIATREASQRRKELRDKLRQEEFPHLSRIAQAASAEDPDLARRFQLPPRGDHLRFVTAAKAIAAEAEAKRELLLNFGMAETLLDALKPQLAEYEELVNKANAGRRAHVGARARLTQILAELMELTHQLDGINEYRLRGDAEKLAAWASARDFAWPKPKVKAPAA